MPVPASFNDIVADAAVRDYVGEVWYQTTVRVPRGWDGQRIVLHFEPATHRATVWVDDAEVVSHEGGYTPFEAEITQHVRAGDEIRVNAAVDNTLSFQTIPPGVVEDTPDGKRQRYWNAFYNYAGLHRPVWLYSTPRSHFTDVTVDTGLAGTDGTDGSVEYRTEAANAEDAEVRRVLRSGGDASAGSTAPTADMGVLGSAAAHPPSVAVEDFVAGLKRPGGILMMVKTGGSADATIDDLALDALEAERAGPSGRSGRD